MSDDVVDLDARREKRKATPAQAAALAAGRAKRQQNIKDGVKPGHKMTRAERRAQNKDTHRAATDAIKRLNELDETAIDVLEQLLHDEDPKVRLQTAKLIVEHRIGRPTQKVESEQITKVVYEIAYEGEEAAS